MGAVRRWLTELRARSDQRVFWIIQITFISLLGCLALFFASYLSPLLAPLRDPGSFVGSFFISFFAGVANFAALGLVVTVVTLSRPEAGSFESRCRILFRGRTGPHIDHLIQGLRKTLEHYAESTEVLVRIEAFDSSHELIRIVEETKFNLCSYVDDADTEYQSAINLAEMASIPAGLPENDLIHLFGNGVSLAQPTSFTTELNVPFSVAVRAHNPTEITYSFRIWMKNKVEPSSFEPKRFTRKVSIAFQNALPKGKAVKVHYQTPGGSPQWDEVLIQPGDKKKLPDLFEQPPNQLSYIYKFEIS